MGCITLHTGPQTNKRSRMATSTVQRSVIATIIIASLLSTTMTAASAAASSPSSWFREKYNEQTYHDYYDYTVSRSSLTDNNRDTCPDFHTSASIFAITGQQINRVTRTCSSLYVNKGTMSTKAKAKYTPSEAHYIQLIEVTVVDVVEFIGVFMCYLIEIVMLLISLILLFWSTLMMVMLLFCQY
jgi:hypothetical protein